MIADYDAKGGTGLGRSSYPRKSDKLVVSTTAGLVCIVELFGSDANGRKMIAWGRKIGCRDAGLG